MDCALLMYCLCQILFAYPVVLALRKNRSSVAPADPSRCHTGIFLENNFKYRNAHNNEFGWAIFTNYRGFFTISCLLFDIFREEWPLDIWFKGPFQILGG